MGKGRDKRRKHEDPVKAARRAARQASKVLKHESKTACDAATDNDQRGGHVSVVTRGINNEEAIETTLKRIQKMQSKHKTIEELADVQPPTPRVNVVLLPHPERPHELLLFGGEYWDGATTTAYNDTYFYNTRRRSWGRLVSAVNPPPRSSAQGVVYKHYVVLFGGEFVSQSQSQYMHFRDVWRYDARRSEWSEVKPARSLTLHGGGKSSTAVAVGGGTAATVAGTTSVGGLGGAASWGPSARSGHRMVLWRRQAVLFGGFYDNAQECHYYNDLWLLSSLDATVQWTRVSTQGDKDGSGEAPHARSGHGMAVYKDTLFVYGGYSTERYNRFRKSEATVHHDLWMLTLPLTGEHAGDGDKDGQQTVPRQRGHGDAGAPTSAVWVKVRLGGVPPPIRAGVAVAFRDRRMYLFGGVVDIESPGGKLVSTFYDDLFVFHMDTRRFYPVVLRPSARRGAKKTIRATTTTTTTTTITVDNNDKEANHGGGKRDGRVATAAATARRGAADGLAAELSELSLQQPCATMRHGEAAHDDKSDDDDDNEDDDMDDDTDGNDDDDDDDDGGRDADGATHAAAKRSEEMKVSYVVRRNGVTYPHRRMDAAVTILDNTLYIYGGQFESGEKELTMSDLFALHLGRLDGYEVLLSQDLSAATWLGNESDGAADNSWESGSTVVSAAFDMVSDETDDDDDHVVDATTGRSAHSDLTRTTGTFARATTANASLIRSALQGATERHNDGDETAMEDDDEVPEAIPVELDIEATPAYIVDAVKQIRGKKSMQAHKMRLLAQLGETATVPTPNKQDTFADFYKRTSAFWLDVAQEACDKNKDGATDRTTTNEGRQDRAAAEESNNRTMTTTTIKRNVKTTAEQERVQRTHEYNARAFAKRRYVEARQLLRQLDVIAEQEQIERDYFREKRREREREREAHAASDESNNDDDNNDKAT